MQETLYLQTLLKQNIKKLDAAMSKTELNLRGWKVENPARVMLVSGWVIARHAADKNVDIAIDLREVDLTPTEGQQLAHLLGTPACPRTQSDAARRAEAASAATLRSQASVAPRPPRPPRC